VNADRAVTLDLKTIDEKALLHAVATEGCARTLGVPMYMELFLSEECNHRCDYCFVRKKNPTFMSREVAFRAVDFLMEESRSVENLGIFFFGGEPLMAFPLLKQVAIYAGRQARNAGKNVSFDMTTNGTLFTEEILKFFKKHKIKFLLSIDGKREYHNRHRRLEGKSSYDEVVSRIPMMKAYQPWLGSRVTVHPDCAPYIAENVEHLFSLGINQFIIGPANGERWTKQRIREYEASLEKVCLFYLEQRRAGRYLRCTIFELGDIALQKDKYKGIWGCGAGRGRICVSAKGELYGCSKLLGLPGVDNGLLKLGDIWEGLTNLQNRLILTDETDRYRFKCQSCKLANSCSGNCVATNYDATGDIFESPAVDCAFTAMYDRIGRYLLSVATPHDLKLLNIKPERTTRDKEDIEDLTHIGSGPSGG
jgi:uncharacterized protein